MSQIPRRTKRIRTTQGGKMKTKVELEIESYAKKYNIEIIGVCRNCKEHWATVREYEVIKTCETCGKKSQIENFMIPSDVINAIKKLEKKAK